MLDRAAGTEQGARDLLERRQQAQCIRKPITIPPPFELLAHNYFGFHICAAPNAFYKRPPSEKLLAKPNSTLPAPFHALVTLPFVLLLVRLRLRASVFPRSVPDATRTLRSRVAYYACLASFLAPRVHPRPAVEPPARAPPSSCSTPRPALCLGRPPLL
jgi:hypothetical protein